MTLPTDPTKPPGAARAAQTKPPVQSQSQSLAGIRELLSLLREIVDRLEDRIDHLDQPRS
jgi:hypothetical protein